MLEMLLEKLYIIALHLEETFTFPEPLGKAEEAIYLDRMKNGDRKAKDILVERNLRLVAHIVKKYYSSTAENEELFSIGTVGLIKAIRSFDPAKGVRLATYAARCIDNEILMFFRNKKKTAMDISFEEPIEQDSDGNPLTLMDIVAHDDTILDDICKKRNIEKLHRFIDEIEDQREKNVLILRYGLDDKEPLTQSDIAEIYGISRSYVSRIESKALKKLRKKFEQL